MSSLCNDKLILKTLFQYPCHYKKVHTYLIYQQCGHIGTFLLSQQCSNHQFTILFSLHFSTLPTHTSPLHLLLHLLNLHSCPGRHYICARVLKQLRVALDELALHPLHLVHELGTSLGRYLRLLLAFPRQFAAARGGSTRFLSTIRFHGRAVTQGHHVLVELQPTRESSSRVRTKRKDDKNSTHRSWDYNKISTQT